MKCDSRTIGREHSKEFDEVTADLNEYKLEEIRKHLNKLLPLITKRMTEHNLLEQFYFNMVCFGSFDVNHIASQLFCDVVKFNKSHYCSTRFTRM